MKVKSFLVMGLMACSALVNAGEPSWKMSSDCSGVYMAGGHTIKQDWFYFRDNYNGTLEPLVIERDGLVVNGKRVPVLSRSGEANTQNATIFIPQWGHPKKLLHLKYVIEQFKKSSVVEMRSYNGRFLVSAKGFKKAWEEYEACQF